MEHLTVPTMQRTSRSFEVVAALALLIGFAPLRAQTPRATPAARSGRDLYVAACANCHAGDGRGAPQTQVGFDVPLPDFTDCSYNSREGAQDWFAVVHQGGPIRGFSQRMPAFGEALTDEEIERVVAYVRALCTDDAWPRGELNLPRAHVTEKAFPEDESVYTSQYGGSTGARALTLTYVHEKRIGARNQLEVKVPVTFQERGATGRGFTGGHFGDVTVALKRALHYTQSLTSARILSGGFEISLPTGDSRVGTSVGTPVAEPFILAAHMLGPNAFVQFHGGLEFPFDRRKANNEAFWRGAIGRSFVPSGFGRMWTPMFEFEGTRTMTAAQPVQWSWIPQLQFGINQRQHIMGNIGVRLPMTNRQGRRPELLAYFLWDWYDGGIRDGW